MAPNPAAKTTGSSPGNEERRALANLPRGSSLERLVREVAAEAVTPRDLVGNAWQAATSQLGLRQQALHDLLGCFDRFLRTEGEPYKVHGGNLRPSLAGRLLLNAFGRIGLPPLAGYAPVRMDPRLFEIVGAMERHVPPVGTPADEAALTMNRLVARICKRLRTKQVINRAASHRARDVTWFGEIRDYLSGIVHLGGELRILRLELRGVAQPLAVIDPGTAARRVHDLAARWFGDVQGAELVDLAGMAWRLQYDEGAGFYHHVLLVMHDGDPGVPLGCLSSLEAVWEAVAGPSAWIKDCKGRGIDLNCREQRNAPCSLEDELFAAAVYLALAGALEDFDFKDDPPLRGFGAWPKTLKAKTRTPFI